jgi:hypothetical protein
MKVERPRARSSAAPTRENSRSTMPIWAMSPARRSPSAPDGDQRVLAQEGRFTAHVGAGQQPDRPIALAVMRRQIAGIGDERARRLAAQRLLDDRMAAAVDGKHFRGIDQRPAIGLFLGKCREPATRRHGERKRCRLDRFGFATTAAVSLSKAASSMVSARSAALAILVSRSASSVVVKRMALAMVWRWMKRALASGLSVIGPALPCVTSMK